MWRYRDYVVRSFNKDKPYNQFIIEQIAGDELWEKQNENEKDPELLVATSFLRMGPWDPAMVLKPQARQLYLDDVVNAVGQTFLSTTMRCFKCHDHKFDPLPTKDYYRMYSIFSGTQLAERFAPFLKKENRNGLQSGKKFTEQMLTFARETIINCWINKNPPQKNGSMNRARNTLMRISVVIYRMKKTSSACWVYSSRNWETESKKAG